MRKGKEMQGLSWVVAGFSLRLKTLKINKLTQTEVCGYEENLPSFKQLVNGGGV
jgi:hypothetical protein